MIVTAVLKATVLRQSLKTYMWIGIGINTVGQPHVTGRQQENANELANDDVAVYTRIQSQFLSYSVPPYLLSSFFPAMILISAISFIPGHMESQPGVYGDPR